MNEGQNSKSGCWAQVKGGTSKAAKKVVKKAALAAMLSLARGVGRLKRMASSFPGPLVDVPLQPRPEGPLLSRSPLLVSQLAAKGYSHPFPPCPGSRTVRQDHFPKKSVSTTGWQVHP